MIVFYFLDSPKLVSLHHEFLECIKENPMKIVTFAESLPTEFTALKVPILCVPINAAGKFKLFQKKKLNYSAFTLDYIVEYHRV